MFPYADLHFELSEQQQKTKKLQQKTDNIFLTLRLPLANIICLTYLKCKPYPFPYWNAFRLSDAWW